MNLYILSENDAIRYSEEFQENTAIISITQPDEDDVVFADNEYIKCVFRMRFYDIVSEIRSSGISPAYQEDFDGLKEFVDSLENFEIEHLVVHCAAGKSRSAAVAAAINEYLDLGEHIWDCPSFYPNMHVYKLACKELGIEKKPSDYEELFRILDESSDYFG